MTEQAAPLKKRIADAPQGGRAVWLDSDGLRIRAAFWPGGRRGAALIFTGRSEYIEKYGRVIAALRARDLSVATLDWRGQGLSGRPLVDRRKGHVEDFGDYQRDVDAFFAAGPFADLPRPFVLIGHSMGGCIAVRSLIDRRAAPALTILSAPMLGLAMPAPARLAARPLIALSRIFGLDDRYVPTSRPEKPYVAKTAFDENALTGDFAHYEWMQGQLDAASRLALGAPTIGWLARAIEETRALAAAPPPTGPILTLLGGGETVVSTDAIRRFADRAPECRLTTIPRARHEIFVETKAIRAKAWAEIDAALDTHMPRA